MTTLRTRANRANALLSTGPRTPAGLARSARNALKVGLFSRHLVLSALDESAEECDAFRLSIVTDLSPVGALETELADRVAQILWRLRRATRYEAGAQAASMGPLPPHPDHVAPCSGHPSYRPLPPTAPVADRLARTRDSLNYCLGSVRTCQAAVDLLDVALTTKPAIASDPQHPVGYWTADHLLSTVSTELGWVRNGPDDPNPWIAVLKKAGFKQADPNRVEWTTERLRQALGAAAGTAGRTIDDLGDAVRGRLRTESEGTESTIRERREQEAVLVAELVRERETAAAGRVCADEGLIARVARAESHLSRELDRTLALLARLRWERGTGCPCESGGGPIGFVLQTGVPGGSPDPALGVLGPNRGTGS